MPSTSKFMDLLLNISKTGREWLYSQRVFGVNRNQKGRFYKGRNIQTRKCEHELKPGVLNEVACPDNTEMSSELTEDPQQKQKLYQRRWLASRDGNNECVREQTGPI